MFYVSSEILIRTKQFFVPGKMIVLLLAILVLVDGKSKQGLRPSPLAGLPEYIVRHKLMKAYCSMLSGRRIHRREELETRCIEKVAFFDDKVSKGLQFIGLLS